MAQQPEAAGSVLTRPAEGDPAGQPDVDVPELRRPAFEVRLENFSGPFDLLLGLIAKHRLDVTEVALAKVTDDFVAHLRGGRVPLEETSEFLLVAATLLDLKAARLLPAAEVEDTEDLALLEARDLLFARLLQYRAYKQVAADLGRALAEGARRTPRSVALEPHLARLLPELVMTVTPEQLARAAGRALGRPAMPVVVGLEHLHSTTVSVREQAELVGARLREVGTATFTALVADADGTLVVVGRFLALLELFREALVAFDQPTPLGELTVRWTGGADADGTAQDGTAQDGTAQDGTAFLLGRIDEFEGAQAPEGSAP